MNLPTLDMVQKLQAALHAKAKGDSKYRFYSLYDKVYRMDVLWAAWRRCRANCGVAGVDGQTFEDIEAYGVHKCLEELVGELKEETYQLLDDMYSDVCPLLPFPFFNVCCDETWELGRGPTKELAEKIGVGDVYVRHIRRVHDLLAEKYQKRMMMWGDIILQHTDRLEEIPKDTIMLLNDLVSSYRVGVLVGMVENHVIAA